MLIEIKEVVYYLEIKNKLIVNSLIKNKEDLDVYKRQVIELLFTNSSKVILL